jgi:electron transfer flavoprotein alpha subunit
MSTILVVTEFKAEQIRKTSLEALTQARRLADQKNGTVTALVISAGSVNFSNVLASHGADQVLVAQDAKVENYHPDFFKHIVLAAVKKTSAQLVLFSATPVGKDLAPRVAAQLQAVMASDCTAVENLGEDIEIQKPLYAGKVLATMVIKGNLKIVSLRPNVFGVKESRPGAVVQEEKLDMPAFTSRLDLKQVRNTAGSKLDVADADIIVTGGRGVRAAENFKLIEDLAAVLKAAVGATRAVVDAGWRTHSEQVGQTGKIVSPNLYILAGASGSIQHWAGMSGSKCIVAINKDANAPIIQRADYSIIGDLFEVLPVLTEEVKKLRS